MHEIEEHPSIDRVKTLPEAWRDHFRNSYESAPTWNPKIIRRALSREVMCVARTRIECAWSAYVGSVPGINHDKEMDPVLNHGARLHEPVARAIFHEFEGVPYAK